MISNEPKMIPWEGKLKLAKVQNSKVSDLKST